MKVLWVGVADGLEFLFYFCVQWIPNRCNTKPLQFDCRSFPYAVEDTFEIAQSSEVHLAIWQSVDGAEPLLVNDEIKVLILWLPKWRLKPVLFSLQAMYFNQSATIVSWCLPYMGYTNQFPVG